MSTRSNIAILNADGTVRACYVHMDGYPEGNGADLIQNFSKVEDVESLLDKGNSSSLNSSFYKDRGDADFAPVTFSSKSAYLTERLYGWIEYQYLFEDGVWNAYKVEDQDENVASVFMGSVQSVLDISKSLVS